MEKITKTGPRFGNPLEWRAVDQGILITALMIPMMGSFLLWCNLALGHTRDGEVFVFAELHRQKLYLWSFIGAGLLICLLGLFLRRRVPDSRVFQHIAVQTFAITMSILGYRTGSLSMVAGVVITGVPLVFYIFFDRAPVIAGMITAMTIIFGTAFASATGHLPYAPVLAEAQGGGERSLFWVSSMVFFFVLPQFAWLFGILVYVIARWRQREAQVRRLSIKDPLTGLFNRRAVMEELQRELRRGQRDGTPLAVVMVDLDYFKSINDTHGHQHGDQALKRASRTLADSLRQSDRIGRFGGEEFLMILPNTSEKAAMEVAERCRARLAATELTAPGGAITMSGSFGIAGLVPGEETISTEELIRRADRALYAAKDGGRDRVVVWREQEARGAIDAPR